MGYAALQNNLTGSYNDASGAGALYTTSTGDANTAHGSYALYYLLAGSGNVGVGYGTLFRLVSGDGNVALGYEVGSTKLRAGSGNILIGTSSLVDTTASNSSNQLNIGNLIYGDLAGGRVGIGSASINSGAALDISSQSNSLLLPTGTTGNRPSAVEGMIRYNSAVPAVEAYYNGGWNMLGGGGSGSAYLGNTATSAAPARGDDPGTGLFSDTASTVEIATAGVERLRVTGAGNVGIGTATPAYQLDIRNSSNIGQVHLSGTGNDEGGYLMATGSSGMHMSGGAAWNGTNWVTKATTASIVADYLGAINFYTDSGLTKTATYAPTQRMVITATGSVGIGTTTPAALLEVSGTAKFDNTVTLTATPVNASDATTKAYVDAAVGGGTWTSQVFTATATWTKPATTTTVNVLLVGGGGAGAGGSGYNGGGGGGGGGCVEAFNSLPVTGNLNVTIGTGGTCPGNGNKGGDGGSTSISGGSAFTVYAAGGRGGGLSTYSGGPGGGGGSGGQGEDSNPSFGGNGGAGPSGDCAGGGGGGGYGYNLSGYGGPGGKNGRGNAAGGDGSGAGGGVGGGGGGGGGYLGAGGNGGTGNGGAGGNGGNYGGGGGGASYNAAGGSGGAGYAIIWWQQ